MEISQTAGIDFIKTRVFGIRQSFIEDMENKLCVFESRLNEKKIRVRWASTEKDLAEIALNLLPEKSYNKACFDLPKIPSAFLKTNAIQNIPLIDVENGTKDATCLFTRADFGIVETGTLVLLDNKSKNCFNRVSNVFNVLDINKLINKMADLETILYVKSFYQSEQFLPSDIKLIEHPYQQINRSKLQLADKSYETIETQFTVFLYDNGITQIMEDNLLRNSLYCIDCEKCKTVCPVFAYTKEYTPIELVKSHCTPKEGMLQHIMKNTMLCGNCDQVCPVEIPIVEMLIKEMENNQPKEATSSLAKIFSKRKKLNTMNGAFRRYFFLKKLFGKNKMIHSYFKQQKDPFFNLTWLQNNKPDEQ